MYLGIEIGGTKLQLGVGTGDGPPLIALERRTVERTRGAAAIREQILDAGRKLCEQFPIERIGYGFGGPVNSMSGRVITSHQVEGWTDFPIVDWTRDAFGLPVRLGNDCDVAALAEATYGAGRGHGTVFYITVGTGIGGGLVIDGTSQGAGRLAIAEIGHLRPGPLADDPHATVESLAAGPGIEAAARALLTGQARHPLIAAGAFAAQDVSVDWPAGRESKTADDDTADLLGRCLGKIEGLDAKTISQAAAAGNRIARAALHQAHVALGWGIAQMVTLLSPHVVVIGGGVSLMGEELFFEPLRRQVRRFVFSPLADSVRLIPAALDEEVVVHGAIALAASA
ncbi:MAG: ROK family protein [Planctomycetota bacterium]|nr:MAG: ROK family protein [Planctomycetota bacterium]